MRQDGNVAVITRTNNRCKLLRRAIFSVAEQTHEYYFHYIADDSADKQPVVDLIKSLPEAIRVKVVLLPSAPQSLGATRLANWAMSHVSTDFAIFLDDDDTWHADLLMRLLKVYRTSSLPNLGGVVCQTMRVYESLSGEDFDTVRFECFNPELAQILITDLCQRNLFTVNAFLFRRDIWQELGGYDSELTVMQDWEFNIRFCSRYEIDVCPEALSNWHIRENSESDQTISAGGLHPKFRAYIRNKKLREDLAAGRIGIGQLMAEVMLAQHGKDYVYARTKGLSLLNWAVEKIMSK